MAFLIPYIASLPFYGLELFVGFIQALVFMMLALVFFTLATQGHGGEAHRGEEHH
jgi:F-type H+-transporting ATPase subunit a